MSAEHEADVALVMAAINSLSEHFDSVQIFITRHEDQKTTNINAGVGNPFTRQGQIREWLIKVDEQARIEQQDASGD
jgi:hypothetical protein